MNEDYSYNIRRILEEGRKCQERGGVMGPTGPRGPQGPATIRVGNTITGAPGTMASVVNAGSLDNAVLTFTIPAGPTGPSGAIGATGPTGPRGLIGPTGAQGVAGPTGPAGPQGNIGLTGPTGPAGPQGNIGLTGPTGPTGPQGNIGPTGPTGPQGNIGPTGPVGPQGDIGPTGPAGPQGDIGLTGPTGPAGPQGNIGPTGPTGPAGPQGNIGPTGPAGPQGDIGLTGPTGPAGPQGDIGPTGPTGPTGPAGAQEEIDFGEKYNTSVDTIALEANIPQNISLGSTGPTSGITTATQNTLTITTAGTYKVDYFFSGSSSADTELSVEVKQNANPIGSTTISKNVTQNENVDFIGSAINTFNNGDEIGLQIKSTAITNISPASGTNAYLNIVKIG